jgi:hypothetical protein
MAARPKRKTISPRAAQNAGTKKAVRPYPGSGSRDPQDYMSWRFDLIYGEPIYGWDTVTSEDRDFLHKWLAEFEGQTTNELFAGGRPGKTYTNPRDIPNSVARARFIEAYDDEDEIHRLACGGLPRFYGFRRGSVFLILWWDKHHEIWPAKKKHT